MKKTILIIDDFETTLFTVEMSLSASGYNVLKAGSAAEALKLLDGRAIHLIVSDLNMPEIDGVELTKEIRKSDTYGHVPILMLSTEIDPEKKKEALEAGVMGWIKKPYDLEEFQRLIKKVIK